MIFDDRSRPRPIHTLLILCGPASALVYVFADIVAAILYPGYSYRDQAVSELFAIGAPTAWLVVPLFSLSSVLLLGFACGVWRLAGRDRWRQATALMFAGSAIVGLLLWNVFPMHMRGSARSFTDTMHLILAANPFVLLSLVAGAMSFGKGFRWYSFATIVILFALATPAFLYAPDLAANRPTPWLGLAERMAQYAFLVWQSVGAGHLAVLSRARRMVGPAGLEPATRPL